MVMLNTPPSADILGQIWGPNGSLLTLKYAKIDANVIGDNTVIAAVASTELYITGFAFIVSADCDITFKSSGGSLLTGPMSFGAKGGMAPADSKRGHFKTVSGEGLVLNIANAVSCQTSGYIVYAELA